MTEERDPRQFPRGRTETFQSVAELAERVVAVEVSDRHRGEALTAHSAALAKLGERKPTSPFTIAAFVAAVAFPIGQLIFNAGQYPTRVDFDTAKAVSEQRDQEHQKTLAELQRELIRQAGRLDVLESRRLLEQKLDAVLAPRRQK